MQSMFGAIEAGGTKFVCAVGSGPNDLQVSRIPTTSPAETLSLVSDFFLPHISSLKALGVASFGPIDLNRASSNYGFITSTPKPGWANTDVVGYLQRSLGVPVAFDTDVNGAALGEASWGAAEGLENFVYLTVGTGIGGGVVANGRLIHGLVHTELGHMLLPKHPDDTYAGNCPFHGDRCFEGLACGPAMKARWGQAAETLPPEHPAWDMQAWYLGAALSSFICSYSPERIILGGGVMTNAAFLGKVREQTRAHLNGYVTHPRLDEGIADYIVSPGLGARAGVLGALELAKQLGAPE